MLRPSQLFSGIRTYSQEDSRRMEETLLNTALGLVPEYGWHRSLPQACHLHSYPGTLSEGLFSGQTPPEWVLMKHCLHLATLHVTEMISLSPSFPKLGTTGKIRFGLWERMVFLMPFMPVWPELLQYGMHPSRAQESLGYLAQFCHQLWILAGDQSIDMQWYTKRGLLAGVLASTELFMTQDRSPNYTETAAFLDRRLEQALSLGYTGAQTWQAIERWGGLWLARCIQHRS